jgi:hypothetical protein
VALNSLLVPAQGFPFGRLAQIATLYVQEQFNFPGPESVAVHITAKQFLN